MLNEARVVDMAVVCGELLALRCLKSLFAPEDDVASEHLWAHLQVLKPDEAAA